MTTRSRCCAWTWWTPRAPRRPRSTSRPSCAARPSPARSPSGASPRAAWRCARETVMETTRALEACPPPPPLLPTDAPTRVPTVHSLTPSLGLHGLPHAPPARARRPALGARGCARASSRPRSWWASISAWMRRSRSCSPQRGASTPPWPTTLSTKTTWSASPCSSSLPPPPPALGVPPPLRPSARPAARG